jgi:hypothetical protein
MELKERLHIGEILIEMLQSATAKLNDPYDDELPILIKRSVELQLRMKRFYFMHDQPPELLSQLETIENIIKGLTELKNKKGI